MTRHAAGPVTAASPEFLRRPKRQGIVAYNTAWGPNEYFPTGTLKNYEYTTKLTRITTPTLVTSGVNDLCTPLIAKTMVDHLPHAEWTLFAHSRHMAFIEEHAAYLARITAWLKQNER